MTHQPKAIIGIDVAGQIGIAATFALEAIPDLIGKRQFAMLCKVIDLDSHENRPLTGEEFAGAIQARHDRIVREEDRARRSAEKNGLFGKSGGYFPDGRRYGEW